MNEPILGAVFDLDGTLVDSQLDFHAMRQEMGLPRQQPILEALESMEEGLRAACQEILERHERAGAEQARSLPGAAEFVRRLQDQSIPCAVVTRNSSRCAEVMLARLRLHFEPVISREDGPVKPDPWALRHICRQWGIPASRVVMIGDFHFDVECGRRAGCRTVLLTHGREPDPRGEVADFLLPAFTESEALISWLGL